MQNKEGTNHDEVTRLHGTPSDLPPRTDLRKLTLVEDEGSEPEEDPDLELAFLTEEESACVAAEENFMEDLDFMTDELNHSIRK